MERPGGPARLRTWKLGYRTEFTLSEKAKWFQVCQLLQDMAASKGLHVKTHQTHRPIICNHCGGANCANAFVYIGTKLRIPLNLGEWQSSSCQKQKHNFNLEWGYHRELESFLHGICYVLGFLYPNSFYVQCEYDFKTWLAKPKVFNRLSDRQGDKLRHLDRENEDRVRSLQKAIPSLADLCQAVVIVNRNYYENADEIATVLQALHLY